MDIICLNYALIIITLHPKVLRLLLLFFGMKRSPILYFLGPLSQWPWCLPCALTKHIPAVCSFLISVSYMDAGLLYWSLFVIYISNRSRIFRLTVCGTAICTNIKYFIYFWWTSIREETTYFKDSRCWSTCCSKADPP